MLETVYDDDKLKMLMDDFKLRPEKGNQKLKNGRKILEKLLYFPRFMTHKTV